MKIEKVALIQEIQQGALPPIMELALRLTIIAK